MNKIHVVIYLTISLLFLNSIQIYYHIMLKISIISSKPKYNQ